MHGMPDRGIDRRKVAIKKRWTSKLRSSYDSSCDPAAAAAANVPQKRKDPPSYKNKLCLQHPKVNTFLILYL